MRDFKVYVRQNLPANDLTEEQRHKIVEEVAQELEEFHASLLTNGLTEDAAWEQTMRQIPSWGNLAAELRIAKRRPLVSRENRRENFLDTIVRDLRYTFRQLRKNAGFSAIVILVSAIGIGANSAIFSIIDAVIIRPLTYRDAGSLVVIDETAGGSRMAVNAVHFNEWRRSARLFESMALIGGVTFNFTGAPDPEQIPGARVSPGLFPLLRTQAHLGRTFSEEEDQPGRDHVALISNELWKSRFGSDANIVGKLITLNGEPYEIVGVLPADFYFPRLSQLYSGITAGRRPEIWKPFALMQREMSPIGDHNYVSIGRLKQGTSIAEAQAELRAVMSRIRTQFVSGMELDTVIVPLQDQMIGRWRSGLQLVLAAAVIVLLIGCVNIANLMTTRISSRRREFAIRAAIGASRFRLVRQMIVESMLLSALGGALGVFIGYIGIISILAVAPIDIPRLDEVRLDTRVFLFAFATSAVTGLLIGLVPALRVGRKDLQEALASSARSTTVNRRAAFSRSALISAEVGLSIVSLIIGGLLFRSFFKLVSVDRGFDTRGTTTVDVTFSDTRYPTLDKKSDFIRRALDRLQALPGVTAVGVVNRLPLTGEGGNNSLIAERPSESAQERPIVDIRTVNPDYTGAMGIEFYEGRMFDESDRSRNVALISKSTAERVWPGESPLGKRFRLGAETRPPINVVGVVADVRGTSLDRNPSFTAYVPYWQGSFNFRGISFVVKTLTRDLAAASGIRTALRDVDTELPLSAIRTMSAIVDESVAQRRFQMNLILLFAATATMLASLGIYGVMSNAVTQRTNEVGIRIALGATPGSVRRMVLASALRQVGTGLAIGVPLALMIASSLQPLLFGITPQDALTLAGACGLLILTAFAAAYLPALRASRVDALVALRQD